ncbi:winged helix-turn-helix transcriptional regulator [Methyloradius palustris]|uniref:HxlR family transcriptional regulator n=1 Tax=Methyloradius palustris TaxID=2778876 RepID=A0A8D5G417_9PROT|nr:helix-turn-helix domain-containing protein [Methyloradius palustris]BCM25365.1 HxlR family transcriptional regulator [Methyloradius palustris]
MKINDNIEKSTTLLSLPLRLQRGELLAAECPSRSVLKHVTSQWGVLVLMVLLEGTSRFSQIRKKVNGVSEKMLAQTLQSLESDGFLNRKSFPVVPPHVEYSLTPLGEEVAAHIVTLADWIESNLPRILDARNSAE